MNRFRLILMAAAATVWMAAQPAPLQAQTVKVVSGNGQLVICGGRLVTSTPPFCQNAFMPMVVQVADSNGAPLGGVTVNWAITATGGSVQLNASSSVTDGNGNAQNQLFFVNGLGPTPSQFQQFFQNTITASTSAATATFTLSEAPYDARNPGVDPISRNFGVFTQGLFAGAVLTGQAGTAGSSPITVRIGGSNGAPMPNVGVQLVSIGDPSTSPVVSCVENTGGPGVALSDQSGFVSCTPQFSGTPGNGTFFILIGGGGVQPADPTQLSPLLTTQTMNVTVTPAAVGSIQVISGNSQSGAPGKTLAPFQVEVDGTGGTPLSGQQVSWTSTPAGAIGFTGAVTTTDIAGRTSIVGTLSGVSSGNITVTATSVSDPSKKATFNVTSVPAVVVTGFTMVSGNNQTASVNSAFPQSLVVQVTVSAGSPANVPVQFRVTSGSVTLSATSATTDSSGQAQVNVTAGSVTGAASVEATVATTSGIGTQNFQLTVTPAAPPITSSSFVNGADQQANSLSPCSIGMLVAAAGALGISNAAPSFPGQTVNTNVRISFNNVGAPILSISTLPNGTQQAISFQVPCETAPGSSVPVVVTIGGAATNVNVAVQSASPGIFQQLGSDGVLRAVVVRPDGSFVTVTNPARKGENVSVFVTGMGATSPSVGTFSLPSIGGAPANVTGTVIAGISGGGAPVISAKLSEDLAGVYVVTFTIPAEAATGSNVSISMALIPVGSGTPVYSGTTKIPIQ